jgi:hypothetical protein
MSVERRGPQTLLRLQVLSLLAPVRRLAAVLVRVLVVLVDWFATGQL